MCETVCMCLCMSGWVRTRTKRELSSARVRGQREICLSTVVKVKGNLKLVEVNLQLKFKEGSVFRLS